jgi:hypothetical protein
MQRRLAAILSADVAGSPTTGSKTRARLRFSRSSVPASSASMSALFSERRRGGQVRFRDPGGDGSGNPRRRRSADPLIESASIWAM